MNDLIYRPGELIRDSFVVVSNDGLSEVTTLTNADFTKYLFQDGVLDTDIIVDVSHRGQGLYVVGFSTQDVGVYDLFLKATVSGVIRRWHWPNVHVEPFGTKSLLHYDFGDHTKQVGNPNRLQIRDLSGAVIAEYEVTDTGRERVT